MGANALIPCIAMSSAGMILTMSEKDKRGGGGGGGGCRSTGSILKGQFP